MKPMTYTAIQKLLSHLAGSNPPVRAQLIAEAQRWMEQEPDPRRRPVFENPYLLDYAGCRPNSNPKQFDRPANH